MLGITSKFISTRNFTVLGRALIACGVVASVAPVLGAGAQESDAACFVTPSHSTGHQHGVVAVAAGERLAAGISVVLPEGTIYQNVVAAPDGSTLVSSFLAAGPGPEDGVEADPASLRLMIDGAAQAVVHSSTPEPDAFAVDTSVEPWRVYFPGDVEELTSSPTGLGVASWRVPPGGQTFTISFEERVTISTQHSIHTAVVCESSLSFGETTHSTQRETLSIAQTGLALALSKTASAPFTAAGTSLGYTITATVDEYDADGRSRNGTLYDTVVVDELPLGMSYQMGSSVPEPVVDGQTLTWTIPVVEAGESAEISYKVDVATETGLGQTFENSATASGVSQPGSPEGSVSSPIRVASVSVANGAEVPSISKSVDDDTAGPGRSLTYGVEIAWPAGSAWHDVVISDMLPDGMSFAVLGSISCAPESCPEMSELDAVTNDQGREMAGWFVSGLGPYSSAQTWTWEYTAQVDTSGQFSNGEKIPFGTGLENDVSVAFNLVDRLGGVEPNLLLPNPPDGIGRASALVGFTGPNLSIFKSVTPDSSSSGEGVEFVLEVANNGTEAALDIQVSDPGPMGIQPGGDVASYGTVSQVEGGAILGNGVIGIDRLPAGETRTIKYRISGSGQIAVGNYTNTARIVSYLDTDGVEVHPDLQASVDIQSVYPDVSISKNVVEGALTAGVIGDTVSYEFTVINNGDGAAVDLVGDDVTTLNGVLTNTVCSGGLAMDSAGQVSLDTLIPGAEASCSYDVELNASHDVGDYENTISLSWTDAVGHSSLIETQSWRSSPFSSSATATVSVVAPQLSINKGPDGDSIGNLIQQRGVAVYTIEILNVGEVTARNVVVSDTLPDTLSLYATPSVSSVPVGIASSTSAVAGDLSFTVQIPELPLGQSVLVSIPVRQNGAVPTSDILRNEASVLADDVSSISDEGVLVWIPAIEVPQVTKTTSATTASPGETVTFTSVATVYENSVDQYDVTIIDELPDGMRLESVEEITCSGTLCAQLDAPVLIDSVVLEDGASRFGVFLGDVLAGTGTGQAEYRIEYAVTVAATYRGTGTPAAGSNLIDTTLINRIRPYLSTDSEWNTHTSTSLPDLSVANLRSVIQRRGTSAGAGVAITTPSILLAKSVTNLGDNYEWGTESFGGRGWAGEPGQAVDYSLTITNTGSADAVDIVISDDLAGGLISDVTMDLPDGVSIVDPPSVGDPRVGLSLEYLAAGETTVILVSGRLPSSAILTPGLSGDNRDVGLVNNTGTVVSFSDEVNTLYTSTTTASAAVYVYTPTPAISATACLDGLDRPAGTVGYYSFSIYNRSLVSAAPEGLVWTPGIPATGEDSVPGTGRDTTIVALLSANTTYVVGSAEVDHGSISEPTIDLVDGRERLTFDVGDVAPSLQATVLTMRVESLVDNVQGGAEVSLSMMDGSGSPDRGTQVAGANTSYTLSRSVGCAPPDPFEVVQKPDGTRVAPGDEVVWTGSAGGTDAVLTGFRILDRMPAGVTYQAGGATMVVIAADGTSQTISVADETLTETIVELPDGRTEITWDSPLFAAMRSLTFRIPSTIDTDAPVGSTISNQVQAEVNETTNTSCGDVINSACDTGYVRVATVAEPKISKVADLFTTTWGGTSHFVVDFEVPASSAVLYDTTVIDRVYYADMLPAVPISSSVLTCLSGCLDSDIVPVRMATRFRQGKFGAGWFIGDLEPAATPVARVYRWEFDLTISSHAEMVADGGSSRDARLSYDQTILRWRDDNKYSDAGFVAAGVVTSKLMKFALGNGNTNLGPTRAYDYAGIYALRPSGLVDKTCETLDGIDLSTNRLSTIKETPGSTANLRCTLTISNGWGDRELSYNGNTSVPEMDLVSPVWEDVVPVTSDDGNSAVEFQVVALTASDPTIEWDITLVEGSASVPQATSKIEFSAPGLVLGAGEEISVEILFRVSAVDGPGDSLETKIEATNKATVSQVSDSAGSTFEADNSSYWSALISKPSISVAARFWTGSTYADRINDPIGGCLSYFDAQDSSQDACSSFWRHRSDLTYDYEWLQAQGKVLAGAAPNFEVGTENILTRTLDVTVLEGTSISTISVADQLPTGFRYVAGSARLAIYKNDVVGHVPLGDPTVDEGGQACDKLDTYVSTSDEVAGQEPADELIWTFRRGVAGTTGAPWNDEFAYVIAEDLASIIPPNSNSTATTFEREVRIVFDIEPRQSLADCLARDAHPLLKAATMVTASSTEGQIEVQAPSWIVASQNLKMVKTPVSGFAVDGTTSQFDIDIDFTSRSVRYGAEAASNYRYVEEMTSATLEELRDENPVWTDMMLAHSDSGYESYTWGNVAFTVTDTFIDAGRYVAGSANVTALDPFGRDFPIEATETITETVVDGVQATEITWSFSSLPAPLLLIDRSNDVTSMYPSSLSIDVPFDIPEGTPNGFEYNNHADGYLWPLYGEIIRYSADAKITVSSPAEPPSLAKRTEPEIVTAGGMFEWIIEAQLEADAVWLDLAIADTMPTSSRFVGFGASSCVTSSGADCMEGLEIEALPVTVGDDGTTELRWWLNDVGGVGEGRTVQFRVKAEHIGPEVAGQTIENQAFGVSNDENSLDAFEPLASGYKFESETVTGVAAIGEPSLEIAKEVTSGAGPYGPGEEIIYEIVVSNAGLGDAYSIPVADEADPLTLEDVSSLDPTYLAKGWTKSDPVVRWFIPSLAAGESVTFEVSAHVVGDIVVTGETTASNTAKVVSYQSATGVATNARIYGPSSALADARLATQFVEVEKFAGENCDAEVQVFEPGQAVSWCVEVTNTGTGRAYFVDLVDVLPQDWIYVDGSGRIEDGRVDSGEGEGEGGESDVVSSAAAPVTSANSAGAIEIAWIVGDLDPGDKVVYRYETIGSGESSFAQNTAIVTSKLQDGTPNPAAPAGFRSVASAYAAKANAGLQIAKLPDTQTVVCDAGSGCHVSWEIIVVNPESRALSDVTLIDSLPVGMTLDSATATDAWGPYSLETVAGQEQVTWELATLLQPGEGATFTVAGHFDNAGDALRLVNVAEARAAEVDLPVRVQAIADVYSYGSIGGTIWIDEDGDGVRESGEGGKPGVMVELLDEQGAVVATTTTSQTGTYGFANVEPGDYSIRVVVPEGFDPTRLGSDSGLDPDGTMSIFNVESGESVTGKDGGLEKSDSTTTTTTTTTTTPRNDKRLARTGASTGAWAGLGIVMLGAGVALMLLSSKRRERVEAAS